MQHRVSGPPAVEYAIHQALRLKLLLWALWLPGGALLLAAVLSDGSFRSVPFIPLALAVLTSSALGLMGFWRTQKTGVLHWNGLRWHLSRGLAGEPPVTLDRVDVHLDLQGLLLLRCRGEGVKGALWVWAERRDQPARWHLLRCAVYGARDVQTEGPQGETAAERT